MSDLRAGDGAPLRVLNFLFDDRYGGPQKRVTQVAGKLLDRGVRTTMVLPEGDGNAEAEARKAGVPVLRDRFGRPPRPTDPRRVARWAVGLPGDVLRLRRLVREQRADVAHVNGAFFLAPALAAKLAGVPLVWHLNDTVVPGRVAPLFGALVRALADGVVVAAERVARHYGVASSPHAVIHAPVDVSAFRPRRRSFGEGVARIGLVANKNPLKGHEYFLRAAALVRSRLERPLEVVLAGARLGSYEGYAKRMDDLIEELGLCPVVRDHGFVPDVAPVLEELEVAVLSSTSEASPMAVLEGMAVGLPVVAADVGGVREMLLADPGQAAGKVVPPRDPEALARAILEVLQSPDEALRMGRKGRELAEELFSLEACARRHFVAYGNVARRPVAPGGAVGKG